MRFKKKSETEAVEALWGEQKRLEHAKMIFCYIQEYAYRIPNL